MITMVSISPYYCRRLPTTHCHRTATMTSTTPTGHQQLATSPTACTTAAATTTAVTATATLLPPPPPLGYIGLLLTTATHQPLRPTTRWPTPPGHPFTATATLPTTAYYMRWGRAYQQIIIAAMRVCVRACTWMTPVSSLSASNVGTHSTFRVLYPVSTSAERSKYEHWCASWMCSGLSVAPTTPTTPMLSGKRDICWRLWCLKHV